jgi:PelA/Pel-15E family pectate lyase
LFFVQTAFSQQNPTREQTLDAMKRASRFMVEKVGNNGAYVWQYLPDMSRRWGEAESYSTHGWLQGAGSAAIGQLFLDAYHATGDEYYYNQACLIANTVIQFQHPSGGWNYFFDMAGEESIKQWYETIGRQAWRMEEYQHYYGNATFDDKATISGAEFVLRIYAEKRDPRYRMALDKAINFVLRSQYANGGFPQRFPLIVKPIRVGNEKYSTGVTLNDDVCLNNIEFLLQCRSVLGIDSLKNSVLKTMDLLADLQYKTAYHGWSDQYDVQTLQPIEARTYEPRGINASTTVEMIYAMIDFYKTTGDKKYLKGIPDAIKYLETTKLSPEQIKASGRMFNSQDGAIMVSRYINPDKGLPQYIHRRGSNVENGAYYWDQNPANTVSHMGSFATVNLQNLQNAYSEALKLSADSLRAASPLYSLKRQPLEKYYTRVFGGRRGAGVTPDIAQIIASLTPEGAWLSPLTMTSNPYIECPPQPQSNDTAYVSRNVGDKYDTSPYSAPQPVMGIATSTFMRNMMLLINYLDKSKEEKAQSIQKDKKLAFPTAEGFGKYTSGGRGGKILFVDNLNDEGRGSLRAAVEADGARTVVFRVSGTIYLESQLVITSGDITLAGQSAPGDGVCIANYPFKIAADNVIIRYMRFRMGDAGRAEDDALGGTRHKNIIIDHCSMSWSTDECASFYNNEHFTLQWCILSESLRKSVHAKGEHGYGGIWGGMKATFHHNLLAHHSSRNPRFCGARYHEDTKETEIADFRNNVIYNWGFNSSYAGENGQYNIVNNYYKPGPATRKDVNHRILEAWQSRDYNGFHDFGHFYISGNVMDGNAAVTKNNRDGVDYKSYSDALHINQEFDHSDSLYNRCKSDTLFPFDITVKHTAQQAYAAVLKSAGASLHRDAIDSRIMNEVKTGTAKFGENGMIDSQTQVGGWAELKSLPYPKDSDGDGIPDAWETSHKLNPNDASDGVKYGISKDYTNLEMYLNEIAR